MQRQLIVVVHGVGVRDAGVATGQLSAVLNSGVTAKAEADAAGGTGQPLSREVPWTPHSTDDFMSHEGVQYSDNGLFRVFPAHMRRFRRNSQGLADADPDQERLIADYFWGDIAGTGSSPVKVTVGLIKIVLGLSHAIRENAAEVFPGDTGFERSMRWLARQAALLIHGPVVAFNLALIAGLAVTLGWHTLNGSALSEGTLQKPEAGPFWTELVLGLLLLGIGWATLTKAQVFLVRHLAGWLIVSGLAVIAVDIVQRLAPGVVESLMTHVNGTVFNVVREATDAPFTPDPKGFSVPAALLMVSMVIAWVLSFGAAWIIWAACWFKRGKTGVAVIVPEAIALMSLVWMLLMTVVWTAILLLHWFVEFHAEFKLPSGLDPLMVLSCLRLVTPAGGTLVLLAAVGFGANWAKGHYFGAPTFAPGSYLARREELAERYRMIVGRFLIWTLDLFLVATSGLFILALWATWDGTDTWVDKLMLANDCAMPYLLVLIGLLTALVIAFGREAMAAGVAIFTDILVYLNDYSWTKREVDKAREKGRKVDEIPRTWLEILLRRKLDPKGKRRGYWLRGRIFARMQELMRRLIDDFNPDEIIIVSHSQGTVIAVGVIERMGRSWTQGKPGRKVKLVTMGSPYRHLYGHYFPTDFPPSNLLTVAAPLGRKGLLEDWINIFRVDDFVGTHIDGETKLGVDRRKGTLAPRTSGPTKWAHQLLG